MTKPSLCSRRTMPRLERRRFRQRSQASDESMEEFATALRGLAITCNYGTTLDENLRDQLVEKAHLPKVRERLLLEGSSLTLARAVRIAHQVEECRREVEYVNADSAHVQEVHKQKPSGQHRKRAPMKPRPVGSVCFRCGSPRHMANSPQCKARTQECHKCKKRGHFASVCRGQQTPEQPTTREVCVADNSHGTPSTPVTLLQVATVRQSAL